MLALLALARACGALDAGPMQVVPLLESPTALAHAAALCDELLDVAAFRAHVDACGDVWEVMLGLFRHDQGGAVSSRACGRSTARRSPSGTSRERHGIHVRFFHGRGGSVGRGAADAREAVAAQPPQTRTGRFKVTEQGEVIGARYGLPSLARRNLELAVTSVIAGIAQPPPAAGAAWFALLDRLGGAAQDAYAALVGRSGFPGVLRRVHAGRRDRRHADQLASGAPRRAPLDRRPARDPVVVRLGADARACCPAGTASVRPSPLLRARCAALQAMARDFPFFTILLRSIERALAVADLAIFERYARELVPDAALRDRFVPLIAAEFERTRRSGAARYCEHDRLLAGDPTLARSIELRNPYVDPISFLQLRLLRAYRARRRARPRASRRDPPVDQRHRRRPARHRLDVMQDLAEALDVTADTGAAEAAA